jgi:tetratricopeptide (TPR) repeat protein
MSASPLLLFGLALSLTFTISTWVEPHASQWMSSRGSDNLLQVLLGDGRQLLANHLFVEADVYFHSGYYPSIFDSQHAPTNSQHLTLSSTTSETPAHPGHSAQEEAEEAHEHAMSFLDRPRDWIERFGRKFAITTHTHLAGGKEREILPWLRLSADMDPHRIETYTVAAYWLRRELGKPHEAEQFLREGLHANPKSYEILFELGRLADENSQDPARARNLWELAYRRWQEREGPKPEADRDRLSLDAITTHLARVEEQEGNLEKAIFWLEQAKQVSPDPAVLQRHIEQLRASLGQPRGASSPKPETRPPK